MKTPNRIILLLTGLFFLMLLGFGGFVYFFINNYRYTDFYKRLEIRAITMAKLELEKDEDLDVVKEIRQDFLEHLPNEKIIVIDLDDRDEAEMVRLKYNIPDDFIEEVKQKDRAFYKKQNTFYSGIHYVQSNKNHVVIVSAENYASQNQLIKLRNLLFISLIISVLFIAFIEFYFSKMVMKPLQRIIDGVKKIGTESLNYRIEESKHNDDMRSLTNTFNDMLNRLETSFESQNNFISNASHELNTPLTSIIGEAEVTLSKPRTAEVYTQSLQTILEEAEKLNRKTHALLLLAQTGYNGMIDQNSILRMDELVIEVKATVTKLYPESVIHLDFNLLPENPDNLKVKGNEQLLYLAISNVVMNACKYSGNKQVDVVLGASYENVILVVKDQGIGIPEQDQPYIFDPFYRASNTMDYSGYGIGLPITRNIVKLHRGRLIISSKENEGTTVEISLPINSN
ncbi:sensor histidine kinase [Robertkochia solimangrovi]|uniref:sensor histidine kinase n=1 Tax=Robertkochia solimangrovi TaxID=2213046 RepID=UPI00117CCE23|nr:ATP-binding protein [Robertkochia solimangrovi]TRZ45276.1 two-component sensor histidine kinase [Robertkochia solimangrovi]